MVSNYFRYVVAFRAVVQRTTEVRAIREAARAAVKDLGYNDLRPYGIWQKPLLPIVFDKLLQTEQQDSSIVAIAAWRFGVCKAAFRTFRLQNKYIHEQLHKQLHNTMYIITFLGDKIQV